MNLTINYQLSTTITAPGLGLDRVDEEEVIEIRRIPLGIVRYLN